MSKKDKIKHMTTMGKHLPRQKDGQTETHFLRTQFTRDEALAVSDAITRLKADNQPSYSLIQAFCLSLAEQRLDEPKLIEDMAKWRTRAKLADELAEADYTLALSLLDSFKKAKESKKQPPPAPKPKAAPTPTPPPTQKVRREFVPEPRKR